MDDYFDILRDDMMANYKAVQSRMAKTELGRTNLLPSNLLAGEVKGYYSNVLMFDLVRFSDITKTGRMNSEAAMLINTVVPTVIKVLNDFNGIVLNTSGDQVMAIFGLEPRDAGTSTRSAIQAALYVANFIEHIADKFIGRMLPSGLLCSIGIDQGPIHVTSVGRRGSAGIVALGPPVHIAQNLHFLAGDNEIWVGENVYRSLEPEFGEKFFIPADVGKWPWTSIESGEQYGAFRFVE